MKEVSIIGGGVIGLMTAWRLLEKGAKVTVFDQGEIGREASFAAAGIIGPQAEAERDDAWLALGLKSRALYPGVCARLGVPYQAASLAYLALDELQAIGLKKRVLWQAQRGLAAEWKDDAQSVIADASAELQGAAYFADEGAVAPRALLAALLRAITDKGGVLRPNTQVNALSEISGDAVVVAAGAWASRIAGGDPRVTENAIEPVRGVLMQLVWPGHNETRIAYWKGGYLLPRGGDSFILGASSEPAGFEKEIDADAVSGVKERAFRALPALEEAQIVDTWCGLRPFARRERPYIAQANERLFYAMGLYRNGILLAPETAELLSAAILEGAALPESFAL